MHDTLSRTAVPETADATGPELLEAGFRLVGAAGDVPMLEGRRATVDGQQVAVFRLTAGFAAIDARCPHRDGPLYDGLVADGCVTCPLHNWRIDLASGQVAGQEQVVGVHEVIERAGHLYVRLGSSACDHRGDCDHAGEPAAGAA